MADETTTPPTAPEEERHAETRSERARRHMHRAYLSAATILAIAVVGLIVAWVVANRDTVEVNWLFGSTDAALALVIFVAAALGWVLGMATAFLIRRRTRAPR